MRSANVLRVVPFLLFLAIPGSAAPPDRPPLKVLGVDTFVVGDTVFVPGSKAALRVQTAGVTGLVTSQPLPMATVEIKLASQGQKEAVLFFGRSDLLGTLDARFEVPSWPDGAYEMVVTAKTAYGSREVRRAVNLKRAGKILLVSDKPIYQPRQNIQLRALFLNAADLKPLAAEELLFEIQDPKGNKVFKQALKTSDYGIASCTFALADEINLGNYQINVSAGQKELAEAASKTVLVKKYILPKFKVEIETDKPFYLPKETIKGKIRSDYFFGKPVAGGEVEVKASTFDVAFREFASLKGTTDPDGRWEFELKLPDYFVGQPLQKGDAVVKLEVKVQDTAKHAESGVKTVPVSAQALRLEAVPEGGRVVAGVENRLYLVATTPDGSPARATVTMKGGGKELGKTRTDETGLGVLTVVPDAAEMRDGGWQPTGSFGPERRRFNVKAPNSVLQAKVLDLEFLAQDDKGAQAQLSKSFFTAPSGDRVLLRTDKAIYSAGDTVRGTVLATVEDGSCYLDVVRNRQTVLTKVLVLEKGKGEFSLPLSPEVFGTVELHAYKLLTDGEIMRDARILYVQPSQDLALTVSQDKPVYRPGEQARFRFQVADSGGKSRAAAIGLIVVDEAVYALQELQPGLEKVYFTLEKELSEPKYQIEFGPAESLASLVLAERLEGQKQQVAKVLLAKAEPISNPDLWQNPVQDRVQRAEKDRYAFQSALYAWWGQGHAIGDRGADGKWSYRPGLVGEMAAGNVLPKENQTDPLGHPYSIEDVGALWPELKPTVFLVGQELNRLWNIHGYLFSEVSQLTSNFTKIGKAGLQQEIANAFQSLISKGTLSGEWLRSVSGKSYRYEDLRNLPGFRVRDMVGEVHAEKVSQIYGALSRYGQEGDSWFRVSVYDKARDAYNLPKDVISRLVLRGILTADQIKDVWGHPFNVRERQEPLKVIGYDNRLRFYEVVSAGEDGRFGTADDLVYEQAWPDQGYQELLKSMGYEPGSEPAMGLDAIATRGRGGRFQEEERAMVADEARPMAMPTAAAQPTEKAAVAHAAPRDDSGGAPAEPKKREVRVREYFPETLLFLAQLLTDDKGVAELKVPMADSITTWRMTASANAREGGLGSVGHSVRVFQDFFVDIDLPVALTQNDEVSIPVVVYNYLKNPQKVRLELERGDWFELTGSTVLAMDLQPGEVSASTYRLKVKGLGRKTLQVRADGSSMSDAIKREIEVLPDGKEENLVANGRLEGTVAKSIDIPATAVPDASKILVRLYPGVFSQVVEGMESLLRLPGG